MTQKKHFESIWKRLVEIVMECGVISDMDLMLRLDFSPPSWKVWKPKLLDKARNAKFSGNNPDGTSAEHKIIFYKGNKNWNWQTQERESVHVNDAKLTLSPMKSTITTYRDPFFDEF